MFGFALSINMTLLAELRATQEEVIRVEILRFAQNDVDRGTF